MAIWCTLNLFILRLAIVAGDLQGRQIGPRSYVWAEPAQLDKAAYEFADVLQLFLFFFCN